jgi:hypothetical protein
MRKGTQKLHLSRETLHHLTLDKPELRQAAGGITIAGPCTLTAGEKCTNSCGC